MDLFDVVLLFVAAFLGGAMNSVAGGGSFFSFPALLIAGYDVKIANQTNTVALWPGSAASVGAYRRELRAQSGLLKLLAVVSLVGGLLGALLLLITPNDVLELILPWLMLGATLLFAFSPQINAAIRRMEARRTAASASPPGRPTQRDERRRAVVLQTLISIYGGFFGGGIGILMLATLALMGLDNIHEMNALKTALATLINGIAVATFAVFGTIAWPAALLMAGGAIVGGYGGAALARRIDPRIIRVFVIVVGLLLSAYLFGEAWGLLS